MPNHVHDLDSADIARTIARLIDNLVSLRDGSGEFLLRLDDGRVIDTKGWNDWEWTHGIGLFGIYRYYELTGEAGAGRSSKTGSAIASAPARRRRTSTRWRRASSYRVAFGSTPTPPVRNADGTPDRTHLSPDAARVFGSMVVDDLLRAVPALASSFR